MTEWAEVTHEDSPEGYCKVVLEGTRSDGYAAMILCRTRIGHEGAHNFGTPAQQEAMLQYPRA